MQKLMLSLILLTTLMLPAGLAWSAAFVPKEFDHLVIEAEQIFIGTVTAIQSRKTQTGAIMTDATFSDLQVLKGSGVTNEIVLIVLGGTVGAETFKLGGIPEFQLGIRYLVFSKGNGTTIFPVVGGKQGLFQVKRDSTSSMELVFDADGFPITSSTVRDAMSSTVAPLRDPTLPPEPIPFDTFIQAIKARLSQ